MYQSTGIRFGTLSDQTIIYQRVLKNKMCAKNRRLLIQHAESTGKQEWKQNEPFFSFILCFFFSSLQLVRGNISRR